MTDAYPRIETGNAAPEPAATTRCGSREGSSLAFQPAHGGGPMSIGSGTTYVSMVNGILGKWARPKWKLS